MKEYFFVKVQIGIIAERGVFLKLIDEIESLIDMHQEGGYWDFKREWYRWSWRSRFPDIRKAF